MTHSIIKGGSRSNLKGKRDEHDSICYGKPLWFPLSLGLFSYCGFYLCLLIFFFFTVLEIYFFVEVHHWTIEAFRMLQALQVPFYFPLSLSAFTNIAMWKLSLYIIKSHIVDVNSSVLIIPKFWGMENFDILFIFKLNRNHDVSRWVCIDSDHFPTL